MSRQKGKGGFPFLICLCPLSNFSHDRSRSKACIQRSNGPKPCDDFFSGNSRRFRKHSLTPVKAPAGRFSWLRFISSYIIRWMDHPSARSARMFLLSFSLVTAVFSCLTPFGAQKQSCNPKKKDIAPGSGLTYLRAFGQKDRGTLPGALLRSYFYTLIEELFQGGHC